MGSSLSMNHSVTSILTFALDFIFIFRFARRNDTLSNLHATVFIFIVICFARRYVSRSYGAAVDQLAQSRAASADSARSQPSPPTAPAPLTRRVDFNVHHFDHPAPTTI